MFVGESENCWISKMDVSILHVSTCDHSCNILALNFDTYIASYIPRIMTFEQCQGDLGIKNPSVNHSSKCCSECFIYYFLWPKYVAVAKRPFFCAPSICTKPQVGRAFDRSPFWTSSGATSMVRAQVDMTCQNTMPRIISLGSSIGVYYIGVISSQTWTKDTMTSLTWGNPTFHSRMVWHC